MTVDSILKLVLLDDDELRRANLVRYSCPACFPFGETFGKPGGTYACIGRGQHLLLFRAESASDGATVG